MTSLRKALLSFNAQAFVDRHNGYKESMSERSHEYLLVCPKCAGSRLRWNARKNDWGAFKCWSGGCGISGDTLRLIELLEDTDDEGAIDIVLAGYVGGNAPSQLKTDLPVSPASRTIKKLSRLPQIGWPTGVDVLADTPLHQRAWDYLQTRGIGRDIVHDWRIGYGRMGWLQDYLVFPVFMDGGLVYWQGRAAFEKDVVDTEVSRFRKTLNPRSVPGCATAQDVLFNYDRVKTASHVVIVEGPIDALKVGPHATALLGKVASAAKVQRLLRCRALRYTIYLDRGTEERQQAERLAQQLCTFAPTYLAEPPEGFDPGALSREYNAHVIANAERWQGPQLRSIG